MATYYMRADGTAANKEAAIGPGSTKANCMDVAIHNGETFNAGDIILLCVDGGIYYDKFILPSSGNSGNLITYQSESGSGAKIVGSDTIETWVVEPIVGEDFTDGSGSQLLAYYYFEEASGIRYDETANNNDLADNNTVTRSGTSVQGSYSAQTASATSETLSRADGDLSAGFPFKNGETTGDFTIGGWVRLLDAGGAGDVIWSKKNGTDGLQLDIVGTKFRVLYNVSGWLSISANAAQDQNTWYHVVIRRKAADTNQLSMFVDGIKQAGTGTLADPTENTGAFIIGGSPTGNNIDALFDEWFVIGSALTDAQILDIKTYGLTGTRDAVTTVYKADYSKTTQQVNEDGTILHKIAWDTDFATTSALMPAGSWTYDEANDLIYAWSTDNADPDTHIITAKRDGINLNGQDYIKIQYLRIEDCLKGIDVNWRDEGRLLEGFETVGDWTAAGTGGAVSEDTTNYIQGSKSIKLEGTNGTVSMTKPGLNLGLESDVTFTLGIYTTDLQAGRVIKIYLSSTSNFATSMDSEDLVFSSGELSNSIFGWTRITLAKTDFSATGGAVWSDVVTHMKIESWDTVENATAITFDDFRAIPTANMPIIIGFSFDDGKEGVITEAKDILDGNSQKGTVYVINNVVGDGGYLTEANLDTLYAADWDISNHTMTAQTLSGKSQEIQETEINDMYDWLYTTKGYTRSAAFLAWSGGSYDASAISVAKQNCKLARGVAYTKYCSDLDGLNDDFYWGKGITGDNSAVPIAGIDLVIAQKSIGELYFHDVSDDGAGGVLDLDDDDLQTISDYVKTQTDAGDLLLLTVSEFWDYSHLEGIEIIGNIIIDNEVGIFLGGTAVLPKVYNNTIEGCADGIIQKGKDSIVKNNIVSNSDTREVEYWWGDWTETNNLFYGTINGFNRDGTTLNSDPLFTNSGSGNFTLLPNSPARLGGIAITGYNSRINPTSVWPNNITIMTDEDIIGAYGFLGGTSISKLMLGLF